MSNYELYKSNTIMENFISAACEAEDIFPTSFALAAFDCRRSLEQAVKWVFQKEGIQKGWSDSLKTMVDNPDFRILLPDKTYDQLLHIIQTGNKTAHEYNEVTKESALTSMRYLFSFIKYLGVKYFFLVNNEEYNEDFVNKKEEKKPLSGTLSSSLFDYIWQEVAKRIESEKGIKQLKPHLYFCDFNIGTKNSTLAIDLKNADRKIRMQFYIRKNEQLFATVKSNQGYLEQQLGEALFYTTSETGEAHRVGYWIENIDFTEENANYIADIISIRLLTMKSAFLSVCENYVKK